MLAYFLNLFDYFATMFILRHGGNELNPVVSAMMEAHPRIFPLCKIYIAFILCAWLERSAKEKPEAKYGLLAITIFYALLAVWHINSIIITIINVRR